MELFGTAGIRGPVTEVTPELALAVGRAVGTDAVEGDGTVVVGRDGRETGVSLAAAVEAGATSAGATVCRAGQLPTPALAFASRGRHGVMLTASHNPPSDNGIKLFEDGQEYDRAGEQRIENRVESEQPVSNWDSWGSAESIDVIDEYRDAVVDYATQYGETPEMTVAVDCGNGMASLAVPQVLTTLGAHVHSLNANVDGRFTARESKPTAESLTDLRRFVADGPSSFGLGHDGDADRIVVIDGEGEVVHEDTVLAILAEHAVRASEAADPVVVTTPNASGRIDNRVEAAGGRVERVRLGALHEGIASARAAGTDDTEVAFAAEPWKHIHPRFGGWIDSVASAALLTRLVAESSLDALREPVRERPYRKVSVDCPDEHKADVMAELETALPEQFPEAAVETEYGIRLDIPDDGWTLVRPSGTEPYIRVYAESESVDDLVDTVSDLVRRTV
ncbi:phosphopentomutase/phosphoglucosamine mutase [Halovenus salina]|uniref:phosphopentomutase/phosphoglucosamine mutase n=1 Tax=Halovenus salina TaxID=1510225 RepID=UPI00226098EB|nr:phosphopentomutase/phosphoglucosamine mutase [Halovenus salina]